MKQLTKFLLLTVLAFWFSGAQAICVDEALSDEDNFANCMVDAKKGHADAQYYLGIKYQRGVGVAEDRKEANQWLRMSAEQGYADAQYHLGLLPSVFGYVYKEDGADENAEQAFKIAFNWFYKAAKQGHPDAQNNLGDLYDRGYGVTQDYGEAVKWYRKAAEQGHLNAQTQLGRMYYIGSGVAQDYKESFKWTSKAVQEGDDRLQFSLGLMYFDGTGVAQDYVFAHMWTNIAGANGNKDASEFRDDIAKKMTPSQIEEAQKLAREWMAEHQ